MMPCVNCWSLFRGNSRLLRHRAGRISSTDAPFDGEIDVFHGDSPAQQVHAEEMAFLPNPPNSCPIFKDLTGSGTLLALDPQVASTTQASFELRDSDVH